MNRCSMATYMVDYNRRKRCCSSDWATVLNVGQKRVSSGNIGFSLFQSGIQQPGQPDSGLSKPGSDNRAGFLNIIIGELDR
jgi:hypothetical protein